MKNLAQLLVFTFVLFIACEQKTIDGSDSSTPISESADKKEEKPNDEIISNYFQKIQEIDDLCAEELNLAKSLTWEKVINDERELVRADTYLDDKGNIYKITEQYKEPGFGNQGKVDFYFDNNELFFISHQYDSWKDSNYVMIFDEEFFLNNRGELVKSRQRGALTIDEIQNAEWEELKLNPPSIDRALKVIKEENPFKTHFLSYVMTEDSFFLILGEPKEANEERFITSVMANPNEPFIQSLIANKESLKFKQLDIDYFYDNEPGKPEFTILKDAKWVE